MFFRFKFAIVPIFIHPISSKPFLVGHMKEAYEIFVKLIYKEASEFPFHIGYSLKSMLNVYIFSSYIGVKIHGMSLIMLYTFFSLKGPSRDHPFSIFTVFYFKLTTYHINDCSNKESITSTKISFSTCQLCK
jgi:hypothetical protein